MTTPSFLIRLAFLQLVVLYALAWGIAWQAQKQGLQAVGAVLPVVANEVAERSPRLGDLECAPFPGDIAADCDELSP